MTPTIEELRAQCRIDHCDEDVLLVTYANAAIKKAQKYIKRTLFEESVPENESEGLVIQDDIKLAIMLAVGFWYDCRDASKLPAGFNDLLAPYRVPTL